MLSDYIHIGHFILKVYFHLFLCLCAMNDKIYVDIENYIYVSNFQIDDVKNAFESRVFHFGIANRTQNQTFIVHVHNTSIFY